jgi:DNA-binding NarL/FixJ family response regulator
MILSMKRGGRQQSGDAHAHGVRGRLAPGLDAARAALTTMPSPDALTERDLDVLELLGARLSQREIAACLEISTAAVERHAANASRELRLVDGGPADRDASNVRVIHGRTSPRDLVPGPRVVPILGTSSRRAGRREKVERVLRPLPSVPEPLRGTRCGVSSPGQAVEPTPRGLAILRRLVGRLTIPESAHELSISPTSVKRHTISLYLKLQIIQKLHLLDRRQTVERPRTLDLRPAGAGVEQRLGTERPCAPVHQLRPRSDLGSAPAIAMRSAPEASASRDGMSPDGMGVPSVGSADRPEGWARAATRARRACADTPVEWERVW